MPVQPDPVKLHVAQGPNWPHPAIHDKKLYVRVQDLLLRFDAVGETVVQ